MHLMTSHLADYVVARLRRPPSDGNIVPGSTPVLSFGNASRAVIATLGLNPSRQEFLDRYGRELTGNARRFETLTSLGVRDLATASDAVLRQVANRLINGREAVRQFEAVMGISLQTVDRISGSSTPSDLLVGRLPIGTRVIAWSVNVQSSFGVCNTLRDRLARRVGELGQDDAIA